VRVSILTPSLNQARSIARTLESVLSQEGDFELDLHVQDGGSTDGSVDIIRRYADSVARGDWPCRCRGVRMTWTSEPDRGQSDAINRGLRRATGDIVAFLNSDDTYLPGALQAVAAAFGARPSADIIYGDGDVVDHDGRLLWEWRSREYDQQVMTTYYFMWNSFTNFVMQQATFWRRRVHDRIGLLDESFHYAMDAEYWIRASAAGLRLEHLPTKLATFTMDEGTKSLSSPTIFWEDYLEIFRRYRGARAMEPYLGFHAYNLALHKDLGIDAALQAARAVQDRWALLDPAERAELQRQAHRAEALACVLLSRDLLAAGRSDDARRAFRRGFLRSRHRTAWLATMDYMIGRILGRRIRATLDRLRREMVIRYKRDRYDCRHEAAAAGTAPHSRSLSSDQDVAP
jgi:glycosyltransferase involved in cell wall biosynthesis